MNIKSLNEMTYFILFLKTNLLSEHKFKNHY